MGSKTTYYRRKKQASLLGCSLSELSDNRGKHGNHIHGSSHPRWNKGKLLTDDGYVKIRVGLNHPLADPNGYAFEHLVVWVSAGNPIPNENELLHHKNEDKQDNRYGNLELKTRSNHNTLHNALRGRDGLGRFLPKQAVRAWEEIPEVKP